MATKFTTDPLCLHKHYRCFEGRVFLLTQVNAFHEQPLTFISKTNRSHTFASLALEGRRNPEIFILLPVSFIQSFLKVFIGCYLPMKHIIRGS